MPCTKVLSHTRSREKEHGCVNVYKIPGKGSQKSAPVTSFQGLNSFRTHQNIFIHLMTVVPMKCHIPGHRLIKRGGRKEFFRLLIVYIPKLQRWIWGKLHIPLKHQLLTGMRQWSWWITYQVYYDKTYVSVQKHKAPGGHLCGLYLKLALQMKFWEKNSISSLENKNADIKINIYNGKKKKTTTI